MVRPGRLRVFRIVLLALATLISVPASFVIRRIFFPPKDATHQDPAKSRDTLPIAK